MQIARKNKTTTCAKKQKDRMKGNTSCITLFSSGTDYFSQTIRLAVTPVLKQEPTQWEQASYSKCNWDE